MTELINKLSTKSLTEYKLHLLELQEFLKTENSIKLNLKDFGLILRPFVWYNHGFTFHDFFETCDNAGGNYSEHEAYIEKKKDENDDLNEAFTYNLNFILLYLDNKMPIDFDELEQPPISQVCTEKVHISLIDTIIHTMEKDNVPADAKLSFAKMKAGLEEIVVLKYTAVKILEKIGINQLEEIEQTIHAFRGYDQRLILDALSSNTKEPTIQKFYKNYSKKTESTALKIWAENYIK